MLRHLMGRLDPTSKQTIAPTNSVEEFTKALRALPDRRPQRRRCWNSWTIGAALPGTACTV
jgi:hypothetical protein